MRKIIILGSTGSIGTQALEIIEQNPDKFQVVGLVANTNKELLSAQALKFNVPSSQAVIGAVAALRWLASTE